MTDEDVISKIQKLQALADAAGSEAEAANAAARVQEMCAKYKLDLADIGELDDTEAILEKEMIPLGRTLAWQRDLLSAIGEVNDCIVMRCMVRLSMMPGVPRQASYILVGHATDVEICVELYAWLKDEVERLARVAAKGGRVEGSRLSFKLGVSHTIGHRLRAARISARREASSTALVRVDERSEKVSAYLKSKEIKDCKVRSSHGKDYLQGRIAGDDADIAPRTLREDGATDVKEVEA